MVSVFPVRSSKQCQDYTLSVTRLAAGRKENLPPKISLFLSFFFFAVNKMHGASKLQSPLSSRPLTTLSRSGRKTGSTSNKLAGAATPRKSVAGQTLINKTFINLADTNRSVSSNSGSTSRSSVSGLSAAQSEAVQRRIAERAEMIKRRIGAGQKKSKSTFLPFFALSPQHQPHPSPCSSFIPHCRNLPLFLRTPFSCCERIFIFATHLTALDREDFFGVMFFFFAFVFYLQQS